MVLLFKPFFSWGNYLIYIFKIFIYFAWVKAMQIIATYLLVTSSKYFISQDMFHYTKFYFLFILLLPILSEGFRTKSTKTRLITSLNMGAAKSQEYDENMYNKPIEGITLTERSVELNGRNIHVSRWTPVSPKAGRCMYMICIDIFV